MQDPTTNHSGSVTARFPNNISSTALRNVLEAATHENLFRKYEVLSCSSQQNTIHAEYISGLLTKFRKG